MIKTVKFLKMDENAKTSVPVKVIITIKKLPKPYKRAKLSKIVRIIITAKIKGTNLYKCKFVLVKNV